MNRDYTLTSPSLYGVLKHETVVYEGLKRPVEIAQIFDRPSGSRYVKISDPAKHKIIVEYFHDLYGIFMKKLSHFVVELEADPDESLKLQAMLQELIKVKKLMLQ